MSSYYDEDDEYSFHVRRGRGSPAVYHRPRAARPPYYSSASAPYLEIGGGTLQRSRSHGRRHSPPSPAPAPVIINNRIENYYDEEEDPRYSHALATPAHGGHGRSRSRSRPQSFHRDDDYELEVARREIEVLKLKREEEERRLTHPRPHSYTREDFELESARKELEAIKLKAQREEDEKIARQKKELQAYKDKMQREEEEKRLKREMEFKRLEQEKKEAEEKKAREEAKKKAIEEYKIKEAEKAIKEKKEKEEKEKEYKHRLEDDLRKSGLDERQINAILKKEKEVDPNRPTYTRMARRHLSIETLNRYRIDFEYDRDPEFVLIKRWVPEYEQDFLWNDTRELRERRTSMLMIEGRPRSHSHHKDVEFEFVREKKHKRKPSPSPLIGFLAGGQRRH